MGAAASFMSESARVILAQPEDASDITSIQDGKREISKMRKLILHGMVGSGKYDGEDDVLAKSKVPRPSTYIPSYLSRPIPPPPPYTTHHNDDPPTCLILSIAPQLDATFAMHC